MPSFSSLPAAALALIIFTSLPTCTKADPPTSWPGPSSPWPDHSWPNRPWPDHPCPNHPWPAYPASNGAPTAVIDSGLVVGTTTSLPNAEATVNKFLGVMYAKSPPERFSPPEKPQPFTAPFQAKAWKPACVQQFLYPVIANQFTQAIFNTPMPEESEDCLYLNVYAPSTPGPPEGRAVMFWIYGGGLQFGNAGQVAYDGSAFASYQDVVVVSINYRTNVFGFPNSPELPRTGVNLGFLDQRFALQWVQDNIRAFGGDPNKVTIAGESAGAFSVDTLLTSYDSNVETPPFRAAILESGQISYFGYPFSASNDASWIALSAALNCSSTGSNLACVRNAPATTIKKIVETQSLVFAPVVDNVTLVASPAGARAANKFARVPVLGGTNAQEGRVFEIGSSNVTALLQQFFGLDVPQIIPSVAAAFPVGMDVGVNTGYDVLSQIYTDYIFQCGQALWANETAAQGVPTWRYYFNASFPNTQSFPNAGVFHASELQLVFQTYSGGPILPLTAGPTGILPTNIPPTAQEFALSSFINGAWAQFIREPRVGPGWNALGTFNVSLGVLGTYGSSGVTVIDQNVVDSKCSLFFPAYRAINGDVYGLGQ